MSNSQSILPQAPNAKPTAGIELELHQIFIAFLSKKSSAEQEQSGEINYEYKREPGAANVFHLKGVTCTTDVTTEGITSNKALRDDSKLKTSNGELVNIGFADKNFSLSNSRLANIFEFSTDPLSSPEEIDLAVKRIGIIEQSLAEYISVKVNEGIDLINFATWAEDFNKTHIAEPDLQISLDLDGKEMYIIAKPSKDALPKKIPDMQQTAELLHYPQFNFSASLETMAANKLENILSQEITTSVANKSLPKIISAENELKLLATLVAKDPSYADMVPLKEANLQKAKAPVDRLAQQQQILQSSGEASKKTLDVIHQHVDKHNEASPKLKKLQGFLFILSNYVTTETAKWPQLDSTPKNKYLFFVKHSVSDILKHCLSERDQTLLKDLINKPEAQDAIITELAGGKQNLNKIMYSYDSANSEKIDVSVRDFLMSSLGWKEENEKVCDKLPTAGKILPPLEPEGLRSKSQLSRIVLELRWPGEDVTISKANDLMQATLNIAQKEFSATTRLDRWNNPESGRSFVQPVRVAIKESVAIKEPKPVVIDVDAIQSHRPSGR